jgi:predicted  nucleic acid-binding Zn-ribbon protein
MVDDATRDLVLMVRLQRLYDSIAERLRLRSSPPPEVQELERQNREREQELREMEERIASLESELSEVSRREEQCTTELEHFQKQKSMVTNEREFTAVINEIDFATRARTEAQDRKKAILEEMNSLREEVERRRSARPEEEAAQREVTASWEAARARLTAEIHELMEQAQGLEEKLSPSNRSRFRRLLERKHGTPLAPVVEGSCSFCHFTLRPHLQQRVRRAKEIIQCEHCHRILYLPELAIFQEGEGETPGEV